MRASRSIHSSSLVLERLKVQFIIIAFGINSIAAWFHGHSLSCYERWKSGHAQTYKQPSTTEKNCKRARWCPNLIYPEIGRCLAQTGLSVPRVPPQTMVAIEPVTALNALTFKTLRLRALRDEPQAVCSTYAKESQFTDADWIKRGTQWSDGERSMMFLASDEGVACGIAGSVLDKEDETRAQLVSMWTAPTHRRRGIGRLLVEGVFSWARSRNVRVLWLMVTSSNAAISFYERLGFRRTGRTEPYPNDPSLVEYEMSRSVD